VLAVSGGPDSMALLHGTAALVRSGARHWRLTVAHLDHRLRPDSASDAAFVREACSALGLRFVGAEADVATAARRDRSSIEEAARDARYRFLESVATPGALIATAHTADDDAETVLINLLRGSGLAGARGIPARRGDVIRPLLRERRARLRRWLDEAGFGYRQDPSNADLSFLRNRVRERVLPILEEARPGAIDAILRFARLAAEDDALLDLLAADELARRRTVAGEIDWSGPPPRALGRRVLRLAIGDPSPSAERLDALLDAAEGTRGGLTIELGGGREASVRGRRIRLQ
jgi:tRNA(Ile)-lysidine synthase